MSLISSSDSMHFLDYSSTTMRDQPDNITAAESAIFGTALVFWEQVHYAVQV